MSTAEGVHDYLRGIDYPTKSEDLKVAAQDNGAPPGFVGLLGLLPSAAEFRTPEEVAEQLRHIQGLG